MTTLRPERKALLEQCLLHMPTHVLQETTIPFLKHIKFEDVYTPVGSLCECGGEIQKHNSVPKITLPKPRHRKKRIRKKWLKSWEKEAKKLRLRALLLSPIRTSSLNFICGSCKSSGYQLAAKNIFSVQKMDTQPK